ncbi:hypothetical protein DPMN_167569 [Dreissena polymorpha]|uniref:Uncharacterized protein n=1 Tax=Dreissena polymorpha TaxID=45954 RepID=A0A9D4F109_DREPO|nr:hypothetical protein DPMN_167569 [Dreissena polymorpha]
MLMSLTSWVTLAVNNISPTYSERRSIWNGGQHGEVDDHGEQYDQQQCRYHHERRKALRSDQLQVLGCNPVKG